MAKPKSKAMLTIRCGRVDSEEELALLDITSRDVLQLRRQEELPHAPIIGSRWPGHC